MKSYHNALLQPNSHLVKQGLGKPSFIGKLAPQRKSNDLNIHSCTRDEWSMMEYKQEKKVEKRKKELVYLQILVHKKGRRLQYAWDGRCLVPKKDTKRFKSQGLNHFLRDNLSRLRLTILALFVPKQVHSSYMDYVKWKFVHRIFSSAIQVQATQSVIHRSFAISDNLGDVSAKSQIQTVCFDNIGLVLAACLNLLCKNNPRIEAALPFVIYPFFTAIDLFAIYQGLKCVHLPTLNKVRLEIIADKWIYSRTVPSTADVSSAEGMRFFCALGSRLWPLRIGFVNPKEQRTENMASVLQFLRNEDCYFLCMESHDCFLWKQQMQLLLCVHEKAVAADIIMGVLQACYVRVLLTSKESSLSTDCNGHATLKPENGLQRNWQNLLEESKIFAEVEISSLLKEMTKAGWVVKHVFLSPTEQVTYSVLGENNC